GRKGAFASAHFRAFHDAVMPRFLHAGELDLSWIVARDQPVAVAYSLVHAGKVRFYQGGRRPLEKHLRPGIVLHALALRRAIEAGLSEYDFLGGQARYKLDLALATRPLVALRVSRARVRDGARQALESISRRLRP